MHFDSKNRGISTTKNIIILSIHECYVRLFFRGFLPAPTASQLISENVYSPTAVLSPCDLKNDPLKQAEVIADKVERKAGLLDKTVGGKG